MDALSPKELEAVEAGHQLIDNDWEDMCAQIPVDIEGLAQEKKALQRKREVKSVPDLLRLVLAYSMCDWSLRVVGAWACIIGLGNLSDVAVYKRLCGSLTWLGRIIGAWLEKRKEQLAGHSARVRLIDAPVISKPGSKSTDWRLHAKFDLGTFSMTGIELTDASGGETLKRHPAQKGEIDVGDRGYAQRQGLGTVFVALAYAVVRVTWRHVPLETADSKRFDLIQWLRAEKRYPCEVSVWVNTPEGRFEVRLIAQRLSDQAAEEARRRARKASQKHGRTPSKETLQLATSCW